ncbi:MAG: hypothetical protein AAGH15_18915 [Myxococcota bacterium]
MRRTAQLLSLIALGACTERAVLLAVPDAGLAVAPPVVLDDDGDGVPNALEGEGRRDTDRDGLPDSRDTDSDDDGIPDAYEAEPRDALGALPDADVDGLPDLLDVDSDGDGRLDFIDGHRRDDGSYPDHDGDGLEDFRDLDDDQDFLPDVVEIGEFPNAPRDTDRDGAPDFRDEDSDGDGIRDLHEASPGEPDADVDRLPNERDLDADGDGLSDALEAGDDDLATPPVDTDADRIPDFLDRDSDADGLSDELETRLGSDPTRADTDGDGVSDLIELGGGTDLRDRTDNPRIRGDFVFVVPYRDVPEPEKDLLRFRTNLRRADLYFLLDTTESMAAELSAFARDIAPGLLGAECARSGVPCVGDAECGDDEICGLGGECFEDPNIAGCIASLETGLGTYAGGGSSYRNLVSIQPDPARTAAHIPDALGPSGGEALFESAACVADPSVCFGAFCAGEGLGCPGFRDDAVPVLVVVTDAPNTCSRFDALPCPLINDAVSAGRRLAEAGVGFIGVSAASLSGGALLDLTRLATAAGSVSAAGRPFVYAGADASVVPSVLTALREIAAELPLYVELRAEDRPGDAGDALQFIEHLEVSDAGGCEASRSEAVDTDGDGFPDAFPALAAGTPACWSIQVRPNLIEEPGPDPKVFSAELVVRAGTSGSGSPLDRRRVSFLVPADPRFCVPDDPRPDCN